ncbi:MAG TPA: flagellar M-ring protein FliF [Clostridia bacterium]|nr:flagellar M-ring protein FliF [Clostridia bacterium]
MPEFLSKFLQKIVEFWKNLDKSQKTRLYIISGVVVVAVIIGIVVLTRSNMVTVVTNVDPKELKDITSTLSANGIKYKYDTSANSIKVDTKDKNKADLELTMAGLPKGSPSFADAFSMVKITSTESDKKQLWANYNKNRLVKMLKMIDSVSDVDVMLAEPEQNIFTDSNGDLNEPTAIVTITPKGDGLTKEQVNGVVMVVSRSVVGLKPKNVTVVDNTGNVLNKDSADPEIATANSQEEARLAKAKKMQDSLYNLYISPSDSYDTLRVIVSPFINNDKYSAKNKVLKNPDGGDSGVPLKTDTSSETLKNGSVSGEPGINSNPTTTYQINTTGENSSYEKKTGSTDWGYDESVESVEKATSVLDPAKTTATITVWYGKNVKDASKLTPAFISQLKQDASTAFGGVPVSNINVSIHKQAPVVEIPTNFSDTLKDLVNTYGFFALMLFLIIGLMIAVMPRRKKQEAEDIEINADGSAALSGPRFIVPEGPAEPIPEIDLEERSEVKKQIEKFVKQKPDAVAQLLRNWLSDDWDV